MDKMANDIHRAPLVVLIVIILLSGFGSPLRVTTDSESANGMTKEELKITCIGDDSSYWAKKVVSIQIRKQGQYGPIVSIDNLQDLKMGLSSKTNMKGEGYIDEYASRSYLTLTIEKPSVEDAGTYRCQMFSFDKRHQLSEENAITNVTFYNQDISTIVTRLIEKMSGLEKSVQQQGYVISNQSERIQEQDKEIDLLKNNTQYEHELILLKDIIERQKATIKKQEDYIDFLGRLHSALRIKIDEQRSELDLVKDSMKHHNVTIEGQEKRLEEHGHVLKKQDRVNKRRVSVLNETLTQQCSDIQEQVDQLMKFVNELKDDDKHGVAFSMAFNSADKDNDDSFTFSKTITNIDNVYDAATGVFTAPTKGLYVFHLVLTTDGKMLAENGFRLKVNSEEVARLYHDLQPHQSTLSFVIPLKAQDKVWPTIEPTVQGAVMPGYSFFSGFLLRKL